MDEMVKIELRGTPAEMIEVLRFLSTLRADIAHTPVVTAEQPTVTGAGKRQPPERPTKSADVAAQSAEHGTKTAATVSAPVDTRGVPWNAEHHSGTADDPKTNGKGEWRLRRHADEAKKKAYEAPYLNGGNGGTVQPTTGESGGSDDDAEVAEALAKLPPVDENGDEIVTPAPGTPGYEDLMEAWRGKLSQEKISEKVVSHIINGYGYHPVKDADAYKKNPDLRRYVYNYLKSL